MGFGIGTMGADDGYQGPQAASTLTAAQQEAVDLMFQIAGLEDQAQNAEDREQLGKASAIRAKICPLPARLAALRAVQS